MISPSLVNDLLDPGKRCLAPGLPKQDHVAKFSSILRQTPALAQAPSGARRGAYVRAVAGRVLARTLGQTAPSPAPDPLPSSRRFDPMSGPGLGAVIRFRLA